MKQFLLIFVTVFSITYQINAQTYGWIDISNNIPDFPFDTTIINSGTDTLIAGLNDVYFINDNEGWITTWHAFHDTAAILHTTDGGESFEVQITTLPCNAIWMLNENEGYAGGESGFIYKTSNGGSDWNFHGTITSTISDIAFPPQPADTGYACGDFGKIFKVHSTGLISMSNPVGSTNLSSITFPTIEEGWTCGEQVIVHHLGGTWIGDQSYASGGYSDVYFLNNTHGWAVGSKIIHTIDGQNWITQANHDSLTGGLTDVFFLNENEGWFVGIKGQIQHTIDGGDSWTREFENYTQKFLIAVQFTNSHNGYISGNEKTLMKYTEVSGIGDEVENIKFEMYPNPVKNIFEVWCTEFRVEEASIELFDLNGRKLLRKNIRKGNENIEIDVSYLESGMYFCKISTAKKSSTKKIIKE